jgi:outer membrane cobalamin receptor
VPEVETRGEELSIGWLAGERLFVQANATHQDIDDKQADALTQRPEWVGAAQIAWKIGRRTRWSADGQWVSEVFDFQVPIGLAKTPGYQLYGTAVTVEVAQGWDVHARVDNLADKEYEPFIGFPGPDRSFRVGLRRRSR